MLDRKPALAETSEQTKKELPKRQLFSISQPAYFSSAKYLMVRTIWQV
jgi:hypothetical protein